MASDQTIITQGPRETARIGEKLGRHLVKSWEGEKGAQVICLYGQLGSGKTTFVQGLAKSLGITSRLLSPTFIIVRRYNLPNHAFFFYHVDLYRVTKHTELEGLGLSEILADPAALVAVEWAEKLGQLRPEQRIDVWFSLDPKGSHILQLKEHG